MRRPVATLPVLLAVLAVLAAGLTGCGSSQTPRDTSIDIVIEGGTVTPNGERVKASVDAPITLNIDADAAGELHVHSEPQQEVAYDAGASTRTLTITRAGIIDVEVHELDQVVVQLEVE